MAWPVGAAGQVSTPPAAAALDQDSACRTLSSLSPGERRGAEMLLEGSDRAAGGAEVCVRIIPSRNIGGGDGI
ncbi:MAG TPA: hypothetical protein VLJ13_12280, partial [Brevundimonas sp.]|nr:hypothetical protein [Brevundimonas sp.]